MTKQLVAAGFDYSSVDRDAKGKLIYLASQINREKVNLAKSGMAIGKQIAEAHALLAGEGRDGKFAEWVSLVCGFSRRSAYNYMLAFERFSECDNVEQINQDALYALSGPNTPAGAIKEATKLAEKGQRVTMSDVKNLLLKFSDDDRQEAAPKQPKAAAEPDLSQLFTDALEHLRQLALLLDKINRQANNTALRSEIFDSLEVANADLIKWRKVASK
jgi:hypothetical protein